MTTILPQKSENTTLAFSRDMYSVLKEVVDALAQVCDGALEKDSKGFDGSDTRAGHLFAFLPFEAWPLSWFHRAWRWSKKYHRQLEQWGFTCDLIEPPRFEIDTRRIASGEAGMFHMVFENESDELWQAVKQLSGATSRKHAIGGSSRLSFWTHHYSGTAQPLLDFLQIYHFSVSDETMKRLESAESEPPICTGRITVENGTFAIFFQDRRFNQAIKQIEGWSVSNQGGFHWKLPFSSASGLRAFLQDKGFTLSEEAQKHLN